MTPGSEMKERILESAFELFTSRGYDKVSLSEIVEKAGVSKGGLFHHFDSKYALARDTLIWWVNKNMEPGFFGEMMETSTPKEVLIQFIDSMIDIMEEKQGFTRFFWSIFDEAMRRQEDTTIWIDFLEQYSRMIGGLYRQMGARDPEMKAVIFLSNMDGMALYYTMLKQTGKDFDLEALREEFIRTYVTFDEEARE
ncbi:MAG: TetR/AcrR family transcriptional regulator [Candidatus Thermoplasmatota archaeon]|nr:TetR/AcrR family transcriptional regulator [Candidatus Thermoplasmatota archaeon]